MNYIEFIRVGRNISQEELAEGIVARRSYSRYLNEDRMVSLEIVEKFAQKLGIDTKTLLFEYEKEQIKQLDKIKRYYNLVVRRDFEKAQQVENEIKKEVLISDESEIHFRLGMYVRGLYQRRLAQPEFLRLVAGLINYPDILNQNVITGMEATVMGVIQEYSEQERKQIILKLESYIVNEGGQVSRSNYQSRLNLAFMVAKYYGREKEFEKVINITDIAIDICNTHKSYFMLEFLTYYKALAMYRSGMDPEYREPLMTCASTILLRNEEAQLKRFEGYFSKDLGINLQDFVNEFLENRKK